MNGINHIREKKCPKCGENVYIEGVDVEVGYYYPLLHCECGWNESEGKYVYKKPNRINIKSIRSQEISMCKNARNIK